MPQQSWKAQVRPRESNTEVMAPAQNTDMQGQNNLNLDMVGEYMDKNPKDLRA